MQSILTAEETGMVWKKCTKSTSLIIDIIFYSGWTLWLIIKLSTVSRTLLDILDLDWHLIY